MPSTSNQQKIKKYNSALDACDNIVSNKASNGLDPCSIRNKENYENISVNGPESTPLRERNDPSDIYKTISNTSAKHTKHDNNREKAQRDKATIGQPSPKVVANPWSFFNRNTDRRESRYTSDEDEKKDRLRNEHYENISRSNHFNEVYDDEDEDDDENIDAESNEAIEDQNLHPYPYRASNDVPQTKPNTLGRNNSFSHASEEKIQKLKRRFQFFGRKKNKEKVKKVSGADKGYDQDDEKLTGERAQQLFGSLFVAAPSINILASCLLEDEFGISRAPLLLTLLGFKITDITAGSKSRVKRFKIDLEYGVGAQRLKWSVERTAKDLLYLHSKFKFENWRNVRNKNSDLPKFPIPPLRNYTGDTAIGKLRGIPSKKNIEFDTLEPYSDERANTNVTTPTDTHSMISRHSIREHLSRLRSHISNTSISSESSSEPINSRLQKNQEYIREITNYLTELIKLVALKPQSNRLFQFFELSPISSLLSYETGYGGKQGVVHIGGTAKSQGWRVGHFKANDLKGMIDRRSEKWLLVRHSYLMYVSGIDSTLPLDVFLVDSKFKMSYKGDYNNLKEDDESDYDDSSLNQKKLASVDKMESKSQNVFKYFKIVLENSERKLVLIPKSSHEQKLWINSINEMKMNCPWAESHRFSSFAPVRDNCFAQWFVDGRDYFWALSSALEMAKDVIFIHDWWLSPELYLRRPANGNQQWRIDRILKRKAQQGVKIFVIIYRNVGSTVSTDSLYTKHSILSLNEENIHVIRSPNQLLQNTYFWAHHEKLCIVDQTVAFLGGIDLCYGRFDTPDHVIVDDSKVNFASLGPDHRPTNEEFVKFQTFPGKDYSNPRVKDFFELDKPYESMYNREITPRMPWHDVHMVTSGKIARDLARHFVQRWNYLLRQKRPSRFTPLLTPPSDLSDEEAKKLGLDGTCEVQLLRSSGNWSLGLKEHEQSIQNAYLKLIETSEHFVYIENQFFVTSCFIDGNEIHNRIGDALVDRIIRAHDERTNWRAVIVIPLMPGFESQVDEPDGSSVRVIMQCQFMSISRGSTSIFAKLRKYGINPDDYIQFFSLRKWGRIGPKRKLVTEQLYIHAKTMIVDDKAAIIGSANINERSMRGFRDSEVAAIVRDKEVITTTMNGEAYMAGKFPHTLRMRLMREHVGVDVDILDIVERKFQKIEEFARSKEGLKAATNKFSKPENTILSAMVEMATRETLEEKNGTDRWKIFQNESNLNDSVSEIPLDEIRKSEKDQNLPAPLSLPISFNNRTGTHEANKGIRDKKKHSYDARVQHNETHKLDVLGNGLDKYNSKLAKRSRVSSSKFLKDLAHKAMEDNPTGIFLPDIENVKEFLEFYDSGLNHDLDEEEEKIISERNKERWSLLKKISYLQRLAAKDKEQREEELTKRTAAGIDHGISDRLRQNDYCFNPSNLPNVETTKISSSQVGNQEDALGAMRSPQETSDRKPIESTEGMSDNIPIVSLNEEGAREMINGLNSKSIEKFSKFVDPYSFEDPLDDEFYEDIWHEHARRNTEIFRLIFHSQPDNAVSTWKDYKLFLKLQAAFSLSQDQEARLRKRKSMSNNIDPNDDYDSDDTSENSYEGKSQQMINDENMNQNVGLLGHVPPSMRLANAKLAQKNKASNSHYQLHDSKIIEESEEESADEESEGTSQNESISGNMIRNGEFGTDTYNNQANREDESYGRKHNDHSQKDGQGFKDNYINNLIPHDTDSNTISKRINNKRSGKFLKRLHNGRRIFDRDSAERILQEIQGHLVFFPYDWLMNELEGGNWFYNTDRIPPIDIYD